MITEQKAHTETGNKAKNLFTIRALGLDVPLFCVITFEELNALLTEQGLTNNPDGVAEAIIPQHWIDEICTYLRPAQSFAVRSSTAVEDAAGASYAGQFASRLNVNEMSLKEAIKEVWLSPFKAHVAVYEKELTKLQTIPIAIMIQQCIEAEISGVAFSCDPLDPESGTVVVNCLYGLGEGLVSGQLDADQFWIKNNEVIKSAIADKTEQLVYHKNGDLHKVPVEADAIRKESLNTAQLLQLSEIAKKLEQHFGQAQDIEFCYAANKLYLLQSRPVTTLKNGSTDYLVWDNSNIIESYPGITLPLTFSFISPVYAAVYRQFTSILGISKKTIQENEYTFHNMLGLLRGRVYYNLYSWYKLLSLLPGYSLNAGFMEKMMGVSEKFELKDYKKPNGILEKLRVMKLVFSLIGNAFRLPAMRRSFLKKFNAVILEHKNLNIQQCDSFACLQAYSRFENTLAKEWKAPLLNDFFAMIWYGLFQKYVAKHVKQEDGNHNQYFVHSGQVITTEPAVWQQKIASLINNNEMLHTLFLTQSEAVIWEWIQANPNEALPVLVHEYLDKWGDRCFSELKLETVTYTQNPLLFVRILKNTFENLTEKSPHAKATISDPRLGFFRNGIFNFLRRQAISAVSARENLRFERTRAFAEVRKIFLKIGDLFYKEQLIEAVGDIFYLSKEEIFHFIKGSSIQLDLKALIRLRKQEFEIYSKEPEQAQRIKTFGIVYKNHFPAEASGDSILLKGIPCCPGIVRARVKIIHSPNDIRELQGKILVTVSTDPGWVSIFPLVKGILVQRGSVLSHAAIVSREMDIPCIVGIKNITAILKNDMLVEMNGMTGELLIIQEDEKAG